MAKKKSAPYERHRKAVMEKAGPGLVSAVDKLVDQVASENDSVAQRAAKELIDLFVDTVMKEDETEIVVRVEGAPEIGMPDPPEEAAK